MVPQGAAPQCRAVGSGQGSGVARRALERACKANDPAAASKALLAWAATEWPDSAPRSLGAVAARMEDGGGAVRELERGLYASEPVRWQGQALWGTLGRATARPGGTSDDRPPRRWLWAGPPLS